MKTRRALSPARRHPARSARAPRACARAGRGRWSDGNPWACWVHFAPNNPPSSQHRTTTNQAVVLADRPRIATKPSVTWMQARQTGHKQLAEALGWGKGAVACPGAARERRRDAPAKGRRVGRGPDSGRTAWMRRRTWASAKAGLHPAGHAAVTACSTCVRKRAACGRRKGPADRRRCCPPPGCRQRLGRRTGRFAETSGSDSASRRLSDHATWGEVLGDLTIERRGVQRAVAIPIRCRDIEHDEVRSARCCGPAHVAHHPGSA